MVPQGHCFSTLFSLSVISTPIDNYFYCYSLLMTNVIMIGQMFSAQWDLISQRGGKWFHLRYIRGLEPVHEIAEFLNCSF